MICSPAQLENWKIVWWFWFTKVNSWLQTNWSKKMVRWRLRQKWINLSLNLLLQGIPFTAGLQLIYSYGFWSVALYYSRHRSSLSTSLVSTVFFKDGFSFGELLNCSLWAFFNHCVGLLCPLNSCHLASLVLSKAAIVTACWLCLLRCMDSCSTLVVFLSLVKQNWAVNEYCMLFYMWLLHVIL